MKDSVIWPTDVAMKTLAKLKCRELQY